MKTGNLPLELKNLGLNDWFLKDFNEPEQKDHGLARVVAVHKGHVVIRNEQREIQAAVAGKIMHTAESGLDYPVVGDWVYVNYVNDMTFAIIHRILPRKSLLRRKGAGKRTDFQVIASNIDTALIIQSADFDFNLRRLERYLIMVHEGDIVPVVMLSKCDLVLPDHLAREIVEIENILSNCRIIAFSNVTGEGIEEIQSILKPEKTYCLLGSSGVGKTTLLNRLIGEDRFETGSVREKDGKGRHITVHRQLTVLEKGGMMIDTPGLRELGNIGVHTGLDETFGDILTFTGNCRFADCTHVNEPGCAVLEAVKRGEVEVGHYQNYIKIRKESAYYEMSYLQKRQKEKKFGKMIKTMKKEIKQNKR